MKTLSTIALLTLFVPAVAAAQVPPPPPAPPAPPAPAARLTPPTPPAPPAPPAVVLPALASAYEFDVQEMKLRALALADDAFAKSELMQLKSEALANLTYTLNTDFQQNAAIARANASADRERSLYDSGQSALSNRQYERAIDLFDQVIAAKGTRTDGAFYWKAFAQFKLGRANDANTTIDALQKSYKDSKYLAEAKILEAEIKRMGGQAMRPEAEDDEDLKLLALQGLINSDPERAIPLVQGVLTSAGSLKLKDKALYVLALSNAAQAHTILVNIAKTGTPDLQAKAINYLSINRRTTGGKTTIAELVEIYGSAQNDVVKRAIISAIGGSAPFNGFTYAISTSGQNAAPMAMADARAAEVRTSGRADSSTSATTATEAQNALWSIYQKEASKDLKGQILSTLGAMGATDRLVEVARSEKDAELRNRAIRSLGNARADKSGAMLGEIYGSLDQDGKKAVISALGNQNNADTLIAIVRKETDRELKRAIVERLAGMPKNKAAQDYLMEIIK